MTYPNGHTLISSTELAALLSEPQLRIYDTTVLMQRKAGGGYDIQSGRSAYDLAHIPGAAFLDLWRDLSDPDSPLSFTMPNEARFLAAIGAAGINSDKHVVLYNSGPSWWATRLWFMLREFGIDRVQVLDGGFDAWRAAALPVSSTGVHYAPALCRAGVRRAVFVGKDAVRGALEKRSHRLVNALTADVHSGRVTSHARAGRIPGSCNVFALDLLDPQTQRFKPPQQLRTILGAAGLLDSQPVIAYCGGGISATTDAFALWLLGREDVQIYDGSLNEWSRDPALPLAVDPV